MRNVLTSEAVTLVFDFIEDGQFVSPDLASVTYTLRDNAGQAVAGHTNESIATNEGQTTLLLTLPSNVNGKAKTFEIRTVEVKYTVGGRSGSLRQSYRIHDWLPFIASSDEVRGFVGVSSAELPDADIDLVAAYLGLKEDLSDLDTYLTAGDMSAVRANRAIVCHAVMSVSHSIQLRARAVQRSDTAQLERFSNINWNLLGHQASAELAELKQKLSGSTEISYPLFQTAVGIDPVTGA